MIVGKPGTGKSHIAKAVAYQATLQGYDVCYVEADSEFARYGIADADERARQLKAWVSADLLVLDDLFLARRISEHAAELLQTLVHQRYKLRRSVVITSNRVVQDWGRYLGDATMATTILDQPTHAPLRDAGVRGQELPFEGGRLTHCCHARIVPTRPSPRAVCPTINGPVWNGHRRRQPKTDHLGVNFELAPTAVISSKERRVVEQVFC